MLNLKLLQKFNCYNQKNIIKFEYVLSQKHKKLKDYFNNNKNDEDYLSKLKEMHDEFFFESFYMMQGIFEENYILIDEIFQSMNNSASAPRMSIKSISQDVVVEIYKSHSKDFNFRVIKISDNTAFDNILNDNKKYFFSNDLEKLFLEKKYKNPRLNIELMEKLKSKEITWEECWVKYKLQDKSSNSYKSTVVIPMAIRSEDKDKEHPEFYENFFKNVNHSKNSRTIWGFLCFDHKNRKYFINEEDIVSLGYIFADILSLYLMFFYNFFTSSKTIELIDKTLKKAKF
ncbi:hypothetical protein N5U14_05930 [Aliarcobacter butzleri]|uniref:hypothetical protein n=1 Tax=Aliarcobacter butzleri TaxID=28197 RepID=UPI0021B3632C|nr:hypothetical protein [Aliarcobacter butzleri]MCT7610378.1 hypothetical protein [Aliarcobacter butzleri]